MQDAGVFQKGCSSMPDLYDMHTHTNRSFDAEASLAAQCRRAAELGLAGFAVTDHCDVNVQSLACSRTTLAAGGADIRRMQEEAPFSLLQGIELGEPLEDLPYAEEMLALLPYDYVLGSIHNSPGKPDFYYLDCREIDLDWMLRPYFEELIKLAEWGQIDAIAHMTYPIRYITGKYNRKVELSPYFDLIDQLFRTMIEKGIALEVNSSGLRQGLNAPMPDGRFLRRYFALGGRKIVLGSDAHTTRDLAAGIPETMALCREIGFTAALTFRRRKAIEYKL